MTRVGLIGAVLYAKDLPRLSEFYAAVAGLPIKESKDEYAVLGCESHLLVVVKIPPRIAGSIAIETPAVRRQETPIKLVFSVPDIAAARKDASERGGVVDPPEREWEFDGDTVCDGHDPEGNIFQLRSLD
jgi:predicted enzyme related to lactoylglutathione lyase